MASQADTQLQLEREITRLGKGLVVQLFVLMKTAQNYPEGHAAMSGPVGATLSTVREIHRRNEEASLRTRGGHLLLGELRLKPDALGIESFLFNLAMMKRFLIGGIQFTPSVTQREIMEFAYVLKEADSCSSGLERLEQVNARMQERMITSIELEPYVEEGEFERPEDETTVDDRARSRRIYLQTINAVSEVMENTKMGQTLRLRKSKRVVQTMIDQLLAAETNLLGLTTIRCHDEYTYNHSVNVCIISLAMGQRVGLGKLKLCELGMAALFHDIGKSELPAELLNKPTQFTPEDWETIRKHPVLGVKTLMKLKGLDVVTSRIVTGSFEHHLNADLSGYPKYPYRGLSLFGRIISIADCYDALTSSRVYNRVPFPPDKALKFMLDRAGKAYDPLLLKLLVNSIGAYPLGSLLRLNTNELGVVIENSADTSLWDRPRVRIISDPKGNEVDGTCIDLAIDQQRSISEILDSNRYGINTSIYF